MKPTDRDGRKRKHIGFLTAEWARIFGRPIYWICILIGTLIKSADCYFGDVWSVSAYLSNGLKSSALFFMDMANENFGYLLYAILCLCALCGSSLYAQEVREGALLCRIQRMGTVRYVVSRILYAAGSAFLAMILIDLSTSGIIATFFGQGWLYGDVGQSAWRSSLLLQENRRLLYLLLLFGRDGLQACFYAVLAVGVSAFVQNPYALAVVPMIAKYLLDNLLLLGTRLEGLSALMPQTLYDQTGAMILSVSEPVHFLIVILYTCAACLLCGAVLFLRLRSRPGKKKPQKVKKNAVYAAASPNRSLLFDEPRRKKKNPLFASLSAAGYELSVLTLSAKFVVLLLAAWVFMGYFYNGILPFARDFDLTISPAATVFYYSDSKYCNIGFLIFIFLISDLPFRENNQVYLLQRCGSRILCCGQLCASAFFSVLFYGIQFLLSVLRILPRLSLRGWGKVWGSFAGTQAYSLGYRATAEIPQAIFDQYGLWQAVFASFVMVSLTGVCYACILYLLNGLSHGRLGSVSLCLWSVIWILLGRLSSLPFISKLLAISPQHWLNLAYLTPNRLWVRAAGMLSVIAALLITDAVLSKKMQLMG